MKRYILLFIVLSICSAEYLFADKEAWDGEKYHKNSGQQHDTALRTLSYIQFNGNELVLDVGCGSGKVTADLGTYYFAQGSVMGIDVCPSMISKAQSEYFGLLNVQFQVLDATELNFDKQFDIAVSFNVLHWIKDIQITFIHIARALKPQGLFLATFSIDDLTGRYSFGMPIIRELMKSEKWKKYFPAQEPDWNTLSPEDYQQCLQNAGFDGCVEFKMLPDWLFDRREDFIAYCSMIPLKSEIPQELKHDFIDDFVDIYSSKYPPTVDGKYRFLRSEAIIVARKN